MISRAAAIWAGLFALAFVNGTLREIGIKKLLGIKEPLAHQLSCITGICFWTSFTWTFWGWLGITSLRDAVLVGAGWFTATALFETFVLNRKLSWEEILHTYNLFAGEFWGIVLLWIGAMPAVLFILRSRT